MKTSRIILGLFILISLTTINSFAQQEFTLNATPANIISSRVPIDNPDLNGNPQAIIIATPVGNTAVINKHPIGAWFYNNKWNIFNTDHAVMTIGATFKVQYFPQTSDNQFLHNISDQNAGERSYLDNPLLNNKPTAPVRIFQNHAPNNRVAYLNPNEARIVYDTNVGKWYIQNVSLKLLYPNTAYNIIIANLQTPTSTSPNGNATPTNTTPTAAANKPSVLYFKQNNLIVLDNPNVNTALIDGLNNQFFTLAQSSRVVFHTGIDTQTVNPDPFATDRGTTSIWLSVEILNASNAVVAKSFSHNLLGFYAFQTTNSFGISILPAGTYHTRVSINRNPGGQKLYVFKEHANGLDPPTQGGQMIIEIFPD